MKLRALKIFVLVIIAFLFLFTTLAIAHGWLYKDKVYPGVKIETLDVGGMTEKEARVVVERVFVAKGSVNLVFGNRRWPIQLETLGAKVKAGRSSKLAMAVGRDQGLLANLGDRWRAWSAGRTIVNTWNLNNRRARDELEKIAREVDQPEVNAKLLINMAKVSIVPHQDGRLLLVKPSLKILTSGFFRKRKAVKLAVKVWQPEKTTDYIKNLRIERQLAEFSTSLSPTRNGRRHNIELAMGKLNDVYIKPGAVFSFNQTVGPRSRAAGYQDAPVIERGQLVQGIGGGICQVATTLYNAAMISGLPIAERYLHSNYISSYPAGRDATVADGVLDLKFRNDSGGTLLIKSVVLTNAVVFKVYGPNTERTTTFSQPEIANIIPYSTKTETDTGLPPGVKVVEQKGVEGKTVKVTRRVTAGNKKLIEETVVSRYTPRQEVIKVGPAPAPAVANQIATDTP